MKSLSNSFRLFLKQDVSSRLEIDRLDQTNASIVKNDVRMVWEVDAFLRTNSTYEWRTRQTETLD